MNGTEARYEREVLMAAKVSGAIAEYRFEAVTLVLGPDLRYTPDFWVMLADGEIEYHEVKAGLKTGNPLVRDDAKVKIIVASEQWPMHVFRMRWPDKLAGGWAERVWNLCT